MSEVESKIYKSVRKLLKDIFQLWDRDRESKEIGSRICCNNLDSCRGMRAVTARASATITTKKTLTCSW